MGSSLECEVCMIMYNENQNRPRFLPCGHTLCSHCIQNSLRTCNGKLTCPFCRDVGGSGVKSPEDFPTAFALLDLLDKNAPKKCSDALSLRDMENIEYLERKQNLYDNSGSCISSCNERLLILQHAKEVQDTDIECIERLQKKLEEMWNKACAVRDKLAALTKVGNNIVKDLEESQNLVKCSSSKSDLDKVADHAQFMCEVSHNWVSRKTERFLEENAHLNPEVPSDDEETNQSTGAEPKQPDDWTVRSLSRDRRERTGSNITRSRGGLTGGREDGAWRRSGRDNTTRGRDGSIGRRGDEAWRASSRDNTTRGRGSFKRGRGDGRGWGRYGNNTARGSCGAKEGIYGDGWRGRNGDNISRGRGGSRGGRRGEGLTQLDKELMTAFVDLGLSTLQYLDRHDPWNRRDY